jgi:predicted DNA binding CopG/RHH family protein
MPKLAPEEKNLLDSFERGQWESVADVEHAALRYRQCARESAKKDRRVNIHISTRDLLKIQKKALEEGIPYQTLISSILHKYASERLVEKGK